MGWKVAVSLTLCTKLEIMYARPLPLLIGVLYKVQERKDQLMDKVGKMLAPKNKKFLPLLGYYWNFIMAADTNIRPGTNKAGQSEVLEVIEQNK